MLTASDDLCLTGLFNLLINCLSLAFSNVPVLGNWDSAFRIWREVDLMCHEVL